MSANHIECKICGAKIHVLEAHLRDKHPDYTLAKYQAEYPGAPIISEMASQLMNERAAKNAQNSEPAAAAPEAKKPATVSST